MAPAALTGWGGDHCVKIPRPLRAQEGCVDESGATPKRWRILTTTRTGPAPMDRTQAVDAVTTMDTVTTASAVTIVHAVTTVHAVTNRDKP